MRCGLRRGWLLAALLAGSRLAGFDGGRLPAQFFPANDIQAKGPVLAFARTDDSTVFVGSNQLSLFDGRRWQTIEIASAYAFRALAAAPQATRVWVGAAGAIGYVSRDLTDRWIFVSLAARLSEAGISVPREIDFVAATSKGAVFVTSSQVLRWDGERFKGWTAPPGSQWRALGGSGPVWLYDDHAGLLRMADDAGPELARPPAALPPGPLVWLLPPGPEGGARDPSGSGALVGTPYGVYRLTAGSYERLPRLSEAADGGVPVSALALDGDALALATRKRGVVIGTRRDEVTATVGRTNDLDGTAAYCLWRDKIGVLWIGLGDGCARLSGAGRVAVFNSGDGLERGLARRVFVHAGITYALTDKALYRMEDGAGQPAHFAPVIASHPRLCDALSLPSGLWIGGAGGLWLMTERGVVPEVSSPGEVVRLGTAPWLPGGLLYVDTLSLMALCQDETGAWVPSDLGVRFDSAPVSLLAGPDGDLWVSTESDGIYRLSATTGQGLPTVRVRNRYVPGSGLPRFGGRPVLALLGSQLFALTGSAVLRFTGDRGFVPVSELAGWADLAPVSPSRGGGPDGAPSAYWIGQRLAPVDETAPRALLKVHLTENGEGPLAWDPLPAPGLDSIGQITSFDVTISGDAEAVWLGGNGGLMRFDPSRTRPADPPLELQLRELRGTGTGFSEIAAQPGASIGPGSTNIRFVFWATAMGEEPFTQTRLAGAESDWSPPQRKNAREFTGLAPGEYVFMARAIDRYGRAGGVQSYAFRVVAPWYRRWPALLGYAALLVLLAAGGFSWRVRRLKRQTRELDRLVARRTDDLNRSKRELELSNTAKSEFLENISHEIRNPLNGIVGLIGILGKDGWKGRQGDTARALRECSESLTRVFEEVLNFSKLEYGYVEVEERPFSLVSLLEGVRGVFLAAAIQQGNTLTVHLPEGFVDGFCGDEGKIKTIVTNFVGNALRYAPGTPVDVTVGCDELGGNRVDLLMEVTDRGPGVPAEEQELIFKKFVRSARVKKAGIPGTGIGLATCQVMARLMGGSVGVVSPAGDAGRGDPGVGGPGATFFVSLPLARHAVPPPSEVPPAGPPAAAAVAAALVVEDQHYNQVVMADILRELGYAPACVEDAGQAYEAMQAAAFDLMLIDLELPGPKGPEIARRVRAMPGGSGPILIGTSGSDSREASRRCLDAGMDAFLLKPVSAAAIRNAIAEARHRRSGGETGAATAETDSAGNGLDCSAFERYARTIHGGVPEAVGRYVAILRSELDLLAAGAAEASAEHIAAAAHRVCSHASIIGAASLSHVAAELEDGARAGRTDDPDGLERVMQSAREVERQLKAWASARAAECA